MQVVILHGGPEREHKTASPVEHHISARARTIHQPKSFDWHSPTTQQITIRSNGRPDGLQGPSIQRDWIFARVLHKSLLRFVFADYNRLAVNLEILVTPACKFGEEVFQIL